LQHGGDLGMPRLPSLEPVHRLGFGLRASDLDQRCLGPPPAGGTGPLPRRGRRDDTFLLRRAAPALRRLDAGRLALLLRVLRRPRRIAEPRRLVLRRELEERL
jgi:hypothetical protein